MSKLAGPSTVFKQESRVFRFADGQKGADAYLELMDKYGAGQGNYYSMMQAHAQSMSRELALLHIMGPGFRATGDQLLKDALAGGRARSRELTDALGKSQGRTLFERMGDGLLRIIGIEGESAARHMNDYMLGRLSSARARRSPS